MADQDSSRKVVQDDVQLLKRTKISVFVDEALSDILVVTFEFGVKIFRGVLLDSTKRNLPCGVAALNPAFNTSKAIADDDLLYSVNQRFAYTEPHTTKNRKIHISTKYKTNKMTVRLRPRQVLCSKCKGICNENSENVTRKRKNSEGVQIPLPVKRGANAPITRSVHSETNKRRLYVNKPAAIFTSDVDKITATTISRNEQGPSEDSNNRRLEEPLEEDDSTHSLEHSERSEDQPGIAKSTKRLLRKRRPGEGPSSVEDFWDDDEYGEESSRNNNQNTQNNANIDQRLLLTGSSVNTRTIKISYGPQGEGTVLKIPAQIENLAMSDEDSEEDVKNRAKDENNKAARKALKKAKKEARKKILCTAPSYLGGSPRYSIGASSPRYTVGSASPRHGLGAISPRYNITTSDVSSTRRKKHKVKHKKKHRDDKKHREMEAAATAINTDGTEDVCSKEQIVTQKLSINLKRLHNTYTSCRRPPPPSAAENDDESAGSDDLSGGGSGGGGDQVPNFPPLNSPLVVRLNAQTAMTHAIGANGCKLVAGDVVWGKIHGFPWWPGKILTITSGGGGAAAAAAAAAAADILPPPQAHVSWYGSPTSSLIQCDQLGLFLDNFKIRYNKKKRGPYKEAVKQATTEARENAENKLRESPKEGSLLPTAPPPPPPATRSIINVVPPALASPREIDVAS